VTAAYQKHWIEINAQAFDEGQEHHTLRPMIDGGSADFDLVKHAVEVLFLRYLITLNLNCPNRGSCSER